MSKRLIRSKIFLTIIIISILILTVLILYYTDNFTQYLFTNKIFFEDNYIMYDQTHSTVIENFRWPWKEKYINDEYYIDLFEINVIQLELK